MPRAPKIVSLRKAMPFVEEAKNKQSVKALRVQPCAENHKDA
jgi:hypothetical protein